jgi:hypothetical protein
MAEKDDGINKFICDFFILLLMNALCLRAVLSRDRLKLPYISIGGGYIL